MVQIEEFVLRQGRGGTFRPFSETAAVSPRGCSGPLQRALVDFGADVSFGKAGKKLQEHYAIAVPVSTLRRVVYRHGERAAAAGAAVGAPGEEVERLVVEIDGSMIPMVRCGGAGDEDRRKNRELYWKEARLGVAVDPDTDGAEPVYRASFGGVDEAGDALLEAARAAGFGEDTLVLGVGDGASWIVNQIDRQFGLQSEFLVDLYHLCEYLAKAAPACAPADPGGWVDRQKKELIEVGPEKVQARLKRHLEPDHYTDEQAPVRKAYRYMDNRPDQFDYKFASEEGFPLGSGRVESAHGHVLQDRLKISGAWWDARQGVKRRPPAGWSSWWATGAEMEAPVGLGLGVAYQARRLQLEGCLYHRKGFVESFPGFEKDRFCRRLLAAAMRDCDLHPRSL